MICKILFEQPLVEIWICKHLHSYKTKLKTKAITKEKTIIKKNNTKIMIREVYEEK
jgi:hypothetical protein